MVNAYEILQTNKAYASIMDEGIHRYLGHEGYICMDSGGFLFMKEKALNVDPMAILNLFEESKPDSAVVLDHPLEAGLSNYARKKRQLKTLENTRVMILSKKTPDNPTLIPVVHGHSLHNIRWNIQKIKEISDFEIIGIGSLVPSVFNAKGVGGIYNVIKIVSYVRKLFPTKRIHVFGVGSTLTMHLMYYAGADSIDSSGWRTKAAFGAIQLSMVGDRYITQRVRNKKYKDLTQSEIKGLSHCECPICTTKGLNCLRTSFEARALHNAWVYQKEVEIVRMLIHEDSYEKYIEKSLEKSPFRRAFLYAKKVKKGYTT
jgi:tRNA-guanine family transglycosylase